MCCNSAVLCYYNPTEANKPKTRKIMNSTTTNSSDTSTKAQEFFRQGASESKIGFITSKQMAMNTVLNQFIGNVKHVSFDDYIQFKDESLIIFKTGTISIAPENCDLGFYTQVQSKLS